MGRWTIVNAILAVIVALLGFEIARTWAHKLPPIEVPPAVAPPVPEHEPHDKGKRGANDKRLAQQTPAVLVAAIAEKDLFDPSRRAPAPDETRVEVVPVTKPPDNVTVVGVRIFGKDREVFVSDGSQPPAVGRRLRIGDQVAGFTVKKIDPTGVVLTSPSGDTVAMPLTLDKGKGQPPQPGRPATPGRPNQVVRPGQTPAAPASPAAGPQGTSPAAGIAVRPPAQPSMPPPQPRPVPGAQPQAAPPAGTPQTQQLPSEVRQKLEQLRQNDKRPGRRR